MRTLKNLFQNKSISIFFIFSFILIILSFVLSRNIINNYKENLKVYDKNYNKQFFIETTDSIPLDEIVNILKQFDVRFSLSFNDTQNHIKITTIPQNKFNQQYENFILGEFFTDEENSTQNNLAIISSDLYTNDDLVSFPLNDNLNNLNVKGIINNSFKELILPFEKFKSALLINNVNDLYITNSISGEPDSLDLALNSVSTYITNNYPNSTINIFDVVKEDKLTESKIFASNSRNLIILTIINSIILTSLWIGNRKFEIALRKALGATNKDVIILYFKELFILGSISILFSFPLYLILSSLLGNNIFGFDITFNISSLFDSIFLVFITSIMISLPALFYLKNLNVNELLKGD
ncbi:MAG: ABC transporter permease [Sarcina sp.]